MAGKVVRENEVQLNSKRYRTRGGVKRFLTSVLPSKTVTGDWTAQSNPNTSAWTINDQRGGIGLEELIAQQVPNRCWWSTCNLGFSGHIVLPTLVTDCAAGGLATKDGYVIFEYNGVLYACLDEFLRSFDNGNDDWNDVVKTLGGNPTDAAKMMEAMFIACDDKGYYYNPKLFVPNQLTDGELDIWTSGTELTNWTESAGGTLTRESTEVDSGVYSAKLVGGDAGAFNLSQEFTWNDDYQGQEFTVTARCKSSAIRKGTVTIDDGVGTTTVATVGTAWETVTVTRDLSAAATKLEIKLAHQNGASGVTVYFDKVTIAYSETTDPWITKSTIEAKHLIEWDSKAFKMDATNTLAYSTNCWEWTDNGKIPIDNDSTNRLYIDKDADGNDIIYAATTHGVWAHDFANAKWTLTQLQMPDHPNSGKGACVWEDGAFLSAGLDVLKYEVAVPARITSVGLAKDGGMPVEHAGEIMMLIPGYNEMYALVDASEVAGTEYSTIMAYDGGGWQCKWVSATADKAIKCGLVTSAYGEYRLFFATNNKIYHMTLHRNLRNTTKISTDTYALAGIHITPNFDGGWLAGDKLAVFLNVKVGKDVSADETVIVKYRIDRTNQDRDTGWTTLGTIAASGVTTYSFGTSAGVLFKHIQFRFDLARKAADTDETPDIEYVEFAYEKVLKPTWGFSFIVDCSEPYDGYAPDQQLANLITTTETQTLVPFTYDDEDFYVHARLEGDLLTGEGRKGSYNIEVRELV